MLIVYIKGRFDKFIHGHVGLDQEDEVAAV